MQTVEQNDRLTKVFGEWPSFHDAEVLRMVLDRSGPDGPTLDVTIHVFTTTGDIGPQAHYTLTNHTAVTFRFTNVQLEELGGFNGQNVLWDLEIIELNMPDEDGRRLKVDMPASYGVQALFTCARAIVTDVRPFEAAA